MNELEQRIASIIQDELYVEVDGLKKDTPLLSSGLVDEAYRR